MQAIKDSLKRSLFRVYKLGTRLGIHILPVHYASPVPNIIELERTRELWAHQSELPGLTIDLDEQAATLRAVCQPYQHEYDGNDAYKTGIAEHFGPGYGYIEAQALHGFVRHYKPRQIVEVGSGVSTYCLWHAAEANSRESGERARLIAIEPHPSRALRGLAGVELVAQPAQAVPLDTFTRLGKNDLLFIDSSHVVKPGGDVNYLILEVLPRLAPGVIVHFHDISWPYDYQRDVLKTFLHWTESSLLQAYAAHNPRIRVLVCLSHLHYERQDVLREVFPGYVPQAGLEGLLPPNQRPFDSQAAHFPASTYLQVQ